MSQMVIPAPYPHWMLKEIYEQPQTIRDTLECFVEDGKFTHSASPVRDWLRAQHHIVFAASGSSRNASLFAEVRIEELSPLHVDVEYASELIYSGARNHGHGGVIVVSQSGETVDTLAALRWANEQQLLTLSVTNVPASSMACDADISIVTEAGREHAIPATKSFTAQLIVLELIAILAGEAHGALSPAEVASRLADLEALPDTIQQWLPVWHDATRTLTERYGNSSTFLFLGRGVDYPIAREGALKLKESAYIPAEAYPAGEFKHGPQALIDATRPLVVLATRDESSPASRKRYDRVLQLMRDMSAQGATILALVNETDTNAAQAADYVVPVPALCETGLVFAEAVILQMLSYFMAVHRGIDVDAPRNLVKAVVLE